MKDGRAESPRKTTEGISLGWGSERTGVLQRDRHASAGHVEREELSL